jgi:septal ring factor EnvC (AmiA/AmiB activator)
MNGRIVAWVVVALTAAALLAPGAVASSGVTRTEFETLKERVAATERRLDRQRSRIRDLESRVYTQRRRIDDAEWHLTQLDEKTQKLNADGLYGGVVDHRQVIFPGCFGDYAYWRYSGGTDGVLWQTGC